MPIKFACEHCQKRLVVGSRKAGTAAACPSCGRPIRVPDLASVPDQAAAGANSSQSGGWLDGGSPGEPPGAADTFALSSKRPFEEFIVYDDDAEVAYDSEASPFEAALPATHVSVPRVVIYVQSILLGLVAIGAFLLGLMAGGVWRNADSVSAEPNPVTLHGRIEYQSATGRMRPDEGAVLVLLPQSARPEAGAKWPVHGLRPEDPSPDDNDIIIRSIQELGGDYARTDLDGRYSLHGANAGEYFLLVISRRAIRSDNDPPSRADVAQIGRYFTPTLELLNSKQYQWLALRVRGDETRNLRFK